MLFRAFGVAVAAALLVGCTAGAKPTTIVQKELRVSGPEEGVRRFSALQNSRRPALSVSEVTFRVGHDATAVVRLPANYSGDELVQTTREALAAGLHYQYRVTRRDPSTSS